MNCRHRYHSGCAQKKNRLKSASNHTGGQHINEREHKDRRSRTQAKSIGTTESGGGDSGGCFQRPMTNNCTRPDTANRRWRPCSESAGYDEISISRKTSTNDEGASGEVATGRATGKRASSRGCMAKGSGVKKRCPGCRLACYLCLSRSVAGSTHGCLLHQLDAYNGMRKNDEKRESVIINN